MRHFQPHVSKLIPLLCIALFLCSCGPSSTGGNGTTPTATSHTSTAPSPTVATQTDCPPANTARAAIMTSISLGTDPNIFYVAETKSELVFTRYDVTTGHATQVISLPQTAQYSWNPVARLSNDGQWIIFSGMVGTQRAIQMVRVDGQELQTLYCGGVDSLLLSPDQKTLAFNTTTGNLSSLMMLDMGSGKLQTDYTITPDMTYYQPLKWYTNTSLYVIKHKLGVGGTGLFFMRYDYGMALVKDTRLDSNSQTTNFQQMFPDPLPFSPMSADLDTNQNQILTSDCTEKETVGGPSRITIQTLDGKPSTIYTDPNNAIIYARFASSTTILFFRQNMTVFHNGFYPTSENVGVWEINTDGTGLRQVAALPDNKGFAFDQTAYTPSYMMSRDGSQYLIRVGSLTSQAAEMGGLFFGKLQGTSATSVPGDFTGDQYGGAIGWSTF